MDVICTRCDGWKDVTVVEDDKGSIKIEPAYPIVPQYKRYRCGLCKGSGKITILPSEGNNGSTVPSN